jgi:hypothetical protein
MRDRPLHAIKAVIPQSSMLSGRIGDGWLPPLSEKQSTNGNRLKPAERTVRKG